MSQDRFVTDEKIALPILNDINARIQSKLAGAPSDENYLLKAAEEVVAAYNAEFHRYELRIGQVARDAQGQFHASYGILYRVTH